MTEETEIERTEGTVKFVTCIATIESSVATKFRVDAPAVIALPFVSSALRCFKKKKHEPSPREDELKN